LAALHVRRSADKIPQASTRRRVERLRERLETEQDEKTRKVIEAQLAVLDRDNLRDRLPPAA
jgi:hypothetical protein